MHGIWTALVTPFDRQNRLDLDAFKRILKDQKEARVAGVIPCGTTGESPTLSLDEKKILIQTACDELRGSSCKVLAGTGSNNTAETVELSKWASDLGVYGVLIVTPYYNKPTQAGLEAHFLAVANSVKCQVMLYNVPGRTGVSLTPETIVKLAAHPKITALKEASGNPAFTSEILDQLQLKNQKLQILSGDDGTFLPLLSVGAAGNVSVASNLFPREMVALHEAFDAGKTHEALKLHTLYYPLFRDLFIESNPGPIKAAMAYAGWCRPDLRAPLAPLTPANLERLNASLVRCKIQKI